MTDAQIYEVIGRLAVFGCGGWVLGCILGWMGFKIFRFFFKARHD